MKAERFTVSVIAGCFLLLSIGGALLMYVGEWNERRKLPAEMQTPEAIQKYYDGAVCLACYFGGSILILIGIGSTITVMLVWLIIEVSRISKRRSQRHYRGGTHNKALQLTAR